MPPVVPRITRITFDNGSGSTRIFRAEATVKDTAAGQSVGVTITNSPNGLLPPDAPTTFTLRYVDDAGNIIRTVTLDNAAASQSDTFHFTSTGAAGGADRCGTIEIKLQATRTGVGSYDYESDGAPATPPAGFGATADRGYIRGTTTLVEDISNTSLGGAPNTPAQYDESLFVRLTNGAVSYVARALTVAISNTTPALSASTNSTTAVTRDVTFSNVVDERFPAASTSVGVSVTVPNPTLGTGEADWTYTSTTEDTLTIDPRLTCEHLLQLDDSVFATPPLASQSNGQRLTSQIGYLSTNLRGSRGTVTGTTVTEGRNGLTVVTTFQDTAGATTALTQTETTATKGGEAGWVQTFLQWTASLPGGSWTKSVDVTAPSDIDLSAYLLNSTTTHTLLAIDPNIVPIIGGGPSAPNEGDHFSAGMALLIGATLYHTTDIETITPDADPAPRASLFRFKQSTGMIQYLKTDFTWANLGSGQADTHVLTVAAGDSHLFLKTFTSGQTSVANGWGDEDIFVVVTLHFNGTPYSDKTQVGALSGNANKHSGYALDPTGLFK